MDEERLIYLLEKISLSLEKISNSLEKILEAKKYTNFNNTNGNLNVNILNVSSKDINEINNLNNNNFREQRNLGAQIEQQNKENNIEIENKINSNDTNNLIENKSPENEIEIFLKKHNIKIKTLHEEEPADEVLDKIASFIGNKYCYIKDFYMPLKRNLNTGNRFKVCLKDRIPQEISAMCQLGNILYEIAFLEEYSYYKATRTIIAKPNRIPKAINFFCGKWLERFIKTQIINIINKIDKNLSFSYIMNPQIILPNGQDSELDVLFKIKDNFYWFEAKTGCYQSYIHKYSKISNLLRLDIEHSFMILTDINDNTAEDLTSLFKMKVVKIDKFSEIFYEILKKHLEYSSI